MKIERKKDQSLEFLVRPGIVERKLFHRSNLTLSETKRCRTMRGDNLEPMNLLFRYVRSYELALPTVAYYILFLQLLINSTISSFISLAKYHFLRKDKSFFTPDSLNGNVQKDNSLNCHISFHVYFR